MSDQDRDRERIREERKSGIAGWMDTSSTQEQVGDWMQGGGGIVAAVLALLLVIGFFWIVIF